MQQDKKKIKTSEKAMTESSVLDLVKRHKISVSKGAELLGMALQDFIELMGAYHIPLLEYEEGELEKELKVLRKVSRNSKISK